MDTMDSRSSSPSHEDNRANSPSSSDDSETIGYSTPKPAQQVVISVEGIRENLDSTKLTDDDTLEIDSKDVADLYIETRASLDYFNKKYEETLSQDIPTDDKKRIFILLENKNKLEKICIEAGMLYSDCKHPIFEGKTNLDDCTMCD
jgi:hypothetical protein